LDEVIFSGINEWPLAVISHNSSKIENDKETKSSINSCSYYYNRGIGYISEYGGAPPISTMVNYIHSFIDGFDIRPLCKISIQ
jgi:hypothetical protein